MLKLTLRFSGTSNVHTATKYRLSYPLELEAYNRTGKKFQWNVATIKCENILGSFRLYTSRVLELPSWGQGGAPKYYKIEDGTTVTRKDYDSDIPKSTLRMFSFEKRLFLHVDEDNRDAYINDQKHPLPWHFLCKNLSEFKEKVYFWLEYENDAYNTHKFNDELITLHLNVYENDVGEKQ